jgi:hypothetical protein
LRVSSARPASERAVKRSQPDPPRKRGRDDPKEREEQLEIPETPYGISLHEQALDLFEPKACIARAVIVFDPWHVFVPEISVRHGALPRVTAATPRYAFLSDQ